MFLVEIKEFLIHFIESVGYPGIFILMTLESCLIPIPSEITMPLAGALAAEGLMSVHVAAWVGAIANVAGSLAAYGLGAKIPENKITGFLEKYGKFILIPVSEYYKTKEWTRKYGSFVSFFSRLIPGIRTVVSLPAGVAHIPVRSFAMYTFAGSLIWCYVLVYIGYILGERWEEIDVYFRRYQFLIIGVAVAFLVFYIYRQLRLSHKAEKN